VAKGTPEEIAAKWARNASAASGDYSAGVKRVSEAPGQRAARKKEKYRAGVTQSVDKWADRVGNVSLQQWQEATAGMGASRFSEGVQKKQAKMAAFQRDVAPHIAQGKQALDAMPDNTPAEREQRMLAWSRHMRTFQRGRQ
jgi:hypothetical protein